MADEIRIRAQLSFAKSGRSASADSGELSITMAGSKGFQTQQTVGFAAEEALLLGEVPSANAYYCIENLDATNRVDLKPAAGGTVTTSIAPGGVALGQFGPAVAAPFVQANVAAVDILITLVQA